MGLTGTHLAAWLRLWACLSPTQGALVTLQFSKAHAYFIVYPNVKPGQEFHEERCLAGVPLCPAVGAETGLDSPNLPAAGPAWESPWGGIWSDAQCCRAGQTMNPGHVSHMPGAGSTLKGGQWGSQSTPAAGFGTPKGLDVGLCKSNIGPKSALVREA